MVEVTRIMAASFKWSHTHTAAPSDPDPAAGPPPTHASAGDSQASLGQALVGSLLLSPGSWCTQGFVCALQECFSSSVEILYQIPLAFKVKSLGGSQSLCQIPRLGNLLWALELLQQ